MNRVERLNNDLTLRSERSERLEGWARAPRLLPILRDAALCAALQRPAGIALNRFKHLPHPEERREAARLEGWAKVELAGTMDNEEGAHVYMLRC